MNIVDLIVLVAAIVYAVGGYRNGAIVGAFSLIGFFGGAVIGAQVARPIGSHVSGGEAQIAVAIVCVLGVAVLGQVVAVWIGTRARRLVTWRPARAVDSVIGAVLGVVSVLLVAWMVALPLAFSPYPKLVSALQDSRIVRGVDDAMPDGVRNLYSSLRRFIDRSGFPPLFGDLTSPRIVDVLPPDQNVLHSATVSNAQRSVVKVLADAPSCNRGIEGSGFVFAPHRIMTNAHVVAGSNAVEVEEGDESLRASVVLFDPRRDVAVLDVPNLDAPVLSFAGTLAQTNDSALVLGYPENGSFDARAARVRGQELVSGHDIYGDGSVDRQIYAVRSVVRSGNSGGPLLSPDGRVLGMVFATALDSSDTGFALTDAELAVDAAAGTTTTAAVGTGDCV
jgi:S1-C subfamily serine protease